MTPTTSEIDRQNSHGPPFGPVEVEYSVPEEVLSEVRDAYEEAVADGYEEGFTAFFVSHTNADSVTIEPAGT